MWFSTTDSGSTVEMNHYGGTGVYAGHIEPQIEAIVIVGIYGVVIFAAIVMLFMALFGVLCIVAAFVNFLSWILDGEEQEDEEKHVEDGKKRSRVQVPLRQPANCLEQVSIGLSELVSEMEKKKGDCSADVRPAIRLKFGLFHLNVSRLNLELEQLLMELENSAGPATRSEILQSVQNVLGEFVATLDRQKTVFSQLAERVGRDESEAARQTSTNNGSNTDQQRRIETETNRSSVTDFLEPEI